MAELRAQESPVQPIPRGWAAAVHAALGRVRHVGDAEIVALYPYDAETDSFFAPMVVGLPTGDVVGSLPDLTEQLRRFRADEAEGKVPDDLGPASYGPSAGLLAMRQPLVSTEPANELGSSFVRRHH